jgi:hypothetical protein
MRYPTKSSLPAPCKRLLEEMQRINFGRIEQLVIRNGLPVFTPFPRILREMKFPGENGPRPELSAPDFALKHQAREFFEQITTMKAAVIEYLEIHHGIPFRMTFEESFIA